MKLSGYGREIREVCRPFQWALLAVLALILGLQLVALLFPYYTGRIVDGLEKRRPFGEIQWLAIMALCSALVPKIVMEWLRGRIHVSRVVFDIEGRIKELTLGRVTRLSLGQILNSNSGFKQDVIKKGEAAIVGMIELFYFHVAPSVFRIAITVAAVSWLSPHLGLLVAASVGTYVAVSFVINRRMMPDCIELGKRENRLETDYWEIIRNLRLVMLYNQAEKTVGKYRGRFREYVTDGKRVWLSYFWKVTFLREPMTALGQFGVLSVGAYLVHDGSMSLGSLIIVFGWSQGVFSTLDNVGSTQRNFITFSVQISRYFDLLRMSPAVTDVANPIRPEKFGPRIEFKGVGFRYPRSRDDSEEGGGPQSPAGEEPEAVKDVSFVVEPGTVCALVGGSGSGKSTVLTLLMRGYDPGKGEILIDGHDLRRLDLAWWREQVGCVWQVSDLWDDTLGSNMRFGLNGRADSVTDEELEEVAAIARIDEFYPRLGPERFGALIGEGGVRLSGGQRQRVAIGMAIAKSPSLLILDEATNALDLENEWLIHEAVNRALTGRTGIIVAHRLSTIRRADQIVVFKDGTVVGVGKHEDLMASCPAYEALVNREMGVLEV